MSLTTFPAVILNGGCLVRGYTGIEMFEIQTRLRSLGLYNAPLTINGIFDAATALAIRTFQGMHDLLVDEKIGRWTFHHLFPEIAWAFALPVHTPDAFAALREEAVRIALKEIGTKELNHNRGPVEKYAKRQGVTFSKDPRAEGPPYCQYFRWYLYDVAAVHLGIENPLPKTGHCMTAFRAEKKLGWAIPTADAQRGDSGFMRFDGDRGHVMVFSGKDSRPGRMLTVEGNTSSHGQTVGEIRDGDEGVIPQNRLLTTLYGVTRVGWKA